MRNPRTSHLANSTLLLGAIATTCILTAVSTIGCGKTSPVSDSAAPNATSPLSSSDDTMVEAGSPETGSEFTTVTFETEDGLTLGGRVYADPAPATADPTTRWVVLCHMYPADQTIWHQEALGLLEQGYRALTFDFRGYGSSEGRKDIQYLDRDVTAAVGYAREAGAHEVVLVGASMGGTASLVAAAELQALSSIRLAGVVTVSAPVEFSGLSARQAASDITMAVLIVAAEADSAADAAREFASLSGDRGELHIVAGSEHGTDIFAGAQAATVRQLLYDFLRQCMPIGG